MEKPGGAKNEEKLTKQSLRFQLSLKDSAESECPEFSYTELVKDALKKKDQNLPSPKKIVLDDDAKARSEAESMARYFEEKYGGNNAKTVRKRRRDRVRDLADVGYGYDESDPFVDNSECYDEVIPSSLTTQFGGFYINCGTLEFKRVSDDSDMEDDCMPLSAHVKKKKKSEFFPSDESECGEPNGLNKKKKVKKRKGSREIEDKRRRKLSLQGKDKLSKLNKGSKKKQTKVQLLVAKAKAQHHMNTADKLSASKQVHNAKHVSVNGTASSIGETGRNLLEFLDKQDQELNVAGSLDSLTIDKDSSSDEMSLSKLPIRKTSEEPKLPQTIPSNIKEKINSLTKIAKSNENEGKVKFFSPDVNDLLLGIEVGSQRLSNRERSGIYQHLTPHVPCSKDTLIKRMKKLHATKQDESLQKPLQLLKQAIDEVMDEQIKHYDEECAAQHLAKMDDRVLAASTDEDDDGTNATASGEEKTKRTYAPRRKFKWSDKIRSLFYDAIKIKIGQFEMLKNRQNQSAEEYLKNFLETEVKPLWPKGWMQTRMLYKESRDVHSCITGQQVKTKKVPISANKKSVGNKPEKKQLSASQAGALTGTIFGTDKSSAVKPSKESSMSISVNLNSDEALEKLFPSKQKDLMSKAISSAYKDLVQNKTVRSLDTLVKLPLDNTEPKKNTASKPATSVGKTRSESPEYKSQSLYRMLDNLAATSTTRPFKSDSNSNAQKTLKVWSEVSKSTQNTPHASVSKANPAQKSAYETYKESGTSVQKSSASTPKPQTKKTTSKPSKALTVPHNPQADAFGADLWKFAFMPPPGAPHMLPGLSFTPGILPPTSQSLEELSNFMKLQQLQSQMPSTDSFQTYLSSLASGASHSGNQFSMPSKSTHSKPKTPTFHPVTDSSSSKQTSSKDSKQQRAHNSIDLLPKTSMLRQNDSSTTTSIERGSKHFYASTFPAKHGSVLKNPGAPRTSSESASNQKPRSSTVYSKSSMHPARSPTSLSMPAKSMVNLPSKSYSSYSTSSSFSPSNYSNSNQTRKSLFNPAINSYEKMDRAKNSHRLLPETSFVPLPTASDNNATHTKSSLQASLSSHNPLQNR